MTVYEQASQIREVGAGIGLRPSTMDLFRQWGIFDAIAEGELAERLLRDPHRHRRPDHEGRVAGHRRLRGADEHPPHPPRRLHRGPRRRAPRGHGAPRPQARDGRGPGDRSVLTFANGNTVEADLVIGADGIKSTVRQQLFSDQQPVFAGEHAYRAVGRRRRDAHGMVVDDNLRMYIGHGTKVYVLPLRHRNQMSFDVTALNAGRHLDPRGHQGRPARDRRGLRRADRRIARDLDMDTVNVRAVYDIDPVDTWHSDSVVLLGDAAHSMCHHQGQGANSAIMDAGALADASPRRLRRRGAGAVPGDAQAGDRRAAAHLAPGLDRGRDRRRLPRARSPGAQRAGGDADGAAPRDREGPRHPARAAAGPLDPVAMRAAEEAQVPPLERAAAAPRGGGRHRATPSGEVPVRIYTPVEADAYGLLVYFHGGAFFLGSLETHDHVARSLATETGLRVVSVGYRRAPEAAYPAGLRTATGSCAGRGERPSLRWDGGTLAIAGDSSGGTFVAAVAAMAHDDGFDRITHQVLYYPSLDLDFDVDRYPSLRENAEGYGLETAGLKPFNAFYLDSGADPADPLVSPIKREDLTGLPPALIITAEHDPLRDEGELYGRAPARRRGGRDGQPLRRRRPRVRPALLLDPGVPPGLRRDRRLPAGAMTHEVASTPWSRPWGRFGLYSFFIDAPEPAIVDTGIASSPARAWPRAGGARPPHRGRALDPADPRPHRPRRRRARAVGADRPAREVVIHEADAPMLRSRRAHVEEYLDGRGAHTWRPGRRGEAVAAAADAAISGEMEPTVLVRGGETLSLGGDVTVSVHAIPGHTPGSVAYVVDGQRVVSSSATPCRCTAPPTGSPATRTRAYRASLEYLRDEVRPRHLYLGHPYRTADGVPYGVELDREQAARGAAGEPGHRGPRRDAARRYLRDGLQETDSAYSPFARVAEELGYKGDPTLEPSPFFTTMHGYRTQFTRR